MNSLVPGKYFLGSQSKSQVTIKFDYHWLCFTVSPLYKLCVCICVCFVQYNNLLHIGDNNIRIWILWCAFLIIPVRCVMEIYPLMNERCQGIWCVSLFCLLFPFVHLCAQIN